MVGTTVLSILCAASAASSGDMPAIDQNPLGPGYALTKADQLAQGQSGGTDVQQNARTLLNSTINYMLPTLGENAPNYLKRVEFSVKLQDNLKPEWSILTVQPLFQTPNKEQTVFTQLSQRRYNNLGTDRDVTNVGVGYRHLFADNTILVGINTFLDYEWKRAHKRGGAGAEIKWSGLDFTANSYFALSKKTGSGLPGGAQEEVLDGRDFELSAQVPYLPWAKAHAKKYYWNSVANTEDIDGWSASLEANVQQNLFIEMGMKDDNFLAKREQFAMVTFHIPFGEPRPTMLSSKLVSDDAWDMRDMREFTLDKVRRENKIIVERTGSGVVITRGS